MANSEKTEKRAFLVFLIILLLIGLYLLSPFLNEIVLSIALAVLFQPLHQKYLKWTNQRQNTATALSVLSVVIFLLVPIAVILTLVTTQLSSMVVAKESTLPDPSVSSFLTFLQQKLSVLEMKFESWIGIPLNITPLLQKEFSGLAQTLARYSPKVISQTANFFLHSFLMLVVLTYLFRDGNRFITDLIHITPIKDRYEHKLAAEIQKTVNSIFYGQFFTGLLQSLVATAGFYFLGIPGFAVWGCLTFLMSFIPSIGTGAVVVPVVITLFLQGETVKGIIMIVYGVFVIGGVDNLLRPFLMNSTMHPMFLFLSIFGGLALFGPIGLILGPMLMGLLSATIRIYAEDFSNTVVPASTLLTENKASEKK